MLKKQTNKIIFVTLVAFLFRIIIAPLINHGDILVHYDWSKVLYHIGLSKAYFHPTWTYLNPPTQPPAILLLFWFSRHLYQNRHLLAQLHNLIKIPPSFIILWFDQYGEFVLLKLWAILADVGTALIISHLVKKISRQTSLAFIALLFFLFNPIAIFESAIWGQNDILAGLFAILAFVMIPKKHDYLAPTVYLLSIMIKPTTIITAPLFAALFLKNHFQSKHSTSKLIFSIIIPMCLFVLLFLPFVNNPAGFIPQVRTILETRIAPSSKGVIRASVSAFNLYSLVFIIDSTPANINFNLLNIIIAFTINLFFIKTLLKIKKLKSKDVIFLIFLVSQASFLFLPGMLERYFLLGLIPATIMLFIHPQLKSLLLFQNLIWFLNLIYAFFYRHSHYINLLFRSHGYPLIRLLSLFNIIIFFRLAKFFFCHQKELCLKKH